MPWIKVIPEDEAGQAMREYVEKWTLARRPVTESDACKPRDKEASQAAAMTDA